MITECLKFFKSNPKQAQKARKIFTLASIHWSIKDYARVFHGLLHRYNYQPRIYCCNKRIRENIYENLTCAQSRSIFEFIHSFGINRTLVSTINDSVLISTMPWNSFNSRTKLFNEKRIASSVRFCNKLVDDFFKIRFELTISCFIISKSSVNVFLV